jgi:hypothetical protein
VLKAAGETKTSQENIQDWLQLDEGDPGSELLTKEENAAVIFLFTLIRKKSVACSPQANYTDRKTAACR